MEIQAGKQAKSQPMKPNYKPRTTHPAKSNNKEHAFVHRRVFGSVRNPNLEEKPKWRRPSLKPTEFSALPTEPANKTALKPKLVPYKLIPKISPKRTELVQNTPSKPDVFHITAHNPKHVSKEPTTKSSSKTTNPVQTPPAIEVHKKTSPNSKSVPSKPIIEPSPKTAKPEKTIELTLQVPEETAIDLKSVPNEIKSLPSPEADRLVQTIPLSESPQPQKVCIESKVVTNETTTLPSPKLDQPVLTNTTAIEGPQKDSLNPKMVPKEPSTVEPAQPEQTQSVLEVPDETVAKKMVPNSPTTLPSPKLTQSVQTSSQEAEKITPSPIAVQNKQAIELSPKTADPVQMKKAISLEKSMKKKRVSFPEGNSASLKTPGLAKTKANPRVSETPYYTAKRCGKCRFDKMETSSYWLALIKVAEKVDKHIVSAGLFKLALEARAEPIEALKIELNLYMARHGYLSGDPKWRNITTSYGLNDTPNDNSEVQADENEGDLRQTNDD